MSSTDNSTDNRFKKNTQVVGENGNDVNPVGSTINDDILKSRAPGGDENVTEEPHSANSKIERDLQEKGYSTRTTDEELDAAAELKAKLDKRGNAAQ
ncbi:unnamed protein product [Sympodiomycopsis kandeliae]